MAAKQKVVELLDVLGIEMKESDRNVREKDELIKSLIDLVLAIRKDLRDVEMYPMADKIRSNLSDLGIILEDKKERTIWKIENS